MDGKERKVSRIGIVDLWVMWFVTMQLTEVISWSWWWIAVPVALEVIAHTIRNWDKIKEK